MNREERIPVGDRVTIFRRGKKGFYTAEFHQDGKHCRRKLETRNRKVAIQRASQLDAQLIAGTYEEPPTPTTISDAEEAYLQHLQTENRVPRTIDTYKNALDEFRDCCAGFGITKLHQVSATTLDAFRRERRVGRTGRTVFNQAVIVKMFTRWCRSGKLLVDDPFADYRLVMPPTPRKPVPTLDDVWAILGQCHEPLAFHIATIAFTGMRRGECRHLHVEDIEVRSRWVNIVSREATPTKSKESRRVPMHRTLQAFLRRVPDTPGPWYFTAAPSSRYPDGGNWISTDRLNDAFKRAAEKAGLPIGSKAGFTVHSLRRFFKSHCINAGVPKPVVDRWVGHGSSRDLDALYYELSDADSRKWMDHVSFDPPQQGDEK